MSLREDSIDFAEAAKGVATGIFRNQGQVCVAGSRVYIHKKVFDKVLTDICHVEEKMKTLIVPENKKNSEPAMLS